MSKIKQAIENVVYDYIDGKDVYEIAEDYDYPIEFVMDIIETEDMDNY